MLPFRLAVRYIFSRKSSSIVNLIAIVSVVALSLTIAASLFSLSLQNGLESFIAGMYKNIDPAYRVVRTDGKMFDRTILNGFDSTLKISVRKEVKVLLECGDRQVPAIVVGVDTLFPEITTIDSIIFSGRNPIRENSYGILLGRGLAYELGISSGIIKPVKVLSIRKNNGFFGNIPLIQSIELLPVGVYSLDQDTDSRYAYAPLDRIDSLTNNYQLATSLEIGYSEKLDPDKIAGYLGDDYTVQSQSGIRDYLSKMINGEKWVIFALLMMIALLASLSLSGTIVVMKKEKEDDIAVLNFLGLDESSQLKTFFLLGTSLSVISLVIGLFLGLILVLIQENVGILTFGGETFLINCYPVEISPVLWIEVLLSVILIGMIVSFVSSYYVFKLRK